MRKNRTYSLFEKRDGKWVRISPMALPIARARVVWQDAMLAYAAGYSFFERRLRPATKDFQQDAVSLMGKMVNGSAAYDAYYRNVKDEDKPLQT